jgi:hypothetical protein
MTRLPYLLAHVTPRHAEPYLLRQVERRKFERSVMAFIGVKLDPDGPEALPMKRDQGIGEFCGGSCIQECTAQFGKALRLACRTCPE